MEKTPDIDCACVHTGCKAERPNKQCVQRLVNEPQVTQMKNSKLLVVVDESPATRKALQYVLRWPRTNQFRICLAHSPGTPRQLVEYRGAKKDASGI